MNEPSTCITAFADFQEPPRPEDYHVNVFHGVQPIIELDYFRIMELSWNHSDTLNLFPDQSSIPVLRHLVQEYVPYSSRELKVTSVDLIHGHCGFRLLRYIELDLDNAPPEFREWAAGKRFFGWADTIVKHGHAVPVLEIKPDGITRRVAWASVGNLIDTSRDTALKCF